MKVLEAFGLIMLGVEIGRYLQKAEDDKQKEREEEIKKNCSSSAVLTPVEPPKKKKLGFFIRPVFD